MLTMRQKSAVNWIFAPSLSWLTWCFREEFCWLKIQPNALGFWAESGAAGVHHGGTEDKEPDRKICKAICSKKSFLTPIRFVSCFFKAQLWWSSKDDGPFVASYGQHLDYELMVTVSWYRGEKRKRWPLKVKQKLEASPSPEEVGPFLCGKKIGRLAWENSWKNIDSVSLPLQLW